MLILERPSRSTLAIAHPSLLAIILLSSSAYASTISGFVYAKAGRLPLPDIDVELLNNDSQLRNRGKTDGSGRYSFGGLPDGRYTVRVMAFRYDYEDQEAMVEIVTISVRGQGIGSAFLTQDFYMAPQKGSLLETETAVVFAQEVPPEANKLFETAVSDLSNARTAEGVDGLRKAIAIFPKYYRAVYRLGMEMFLQKSYGEAANLFLTAASINEKSATSLYYVGYSLHSLGKDYNKAALVALKNALTLAPASLQVLYLTGKVERAEGKVLDAEQHLLQAKKLSRMPIAEIHRELAQLYANDFKKFDLAANELEAYLKASKLSPEDEKKTKKVIADLKAKAKAVPAKTT